MANSFTTTTATGSSSSTTDLLDTIVQTAADPQSVTVDGQTVTSQRIPDQIAADRYQRSVNATKAGGGLYRRVQLRPGNNADVDRC